MSSKKWLNSKQSNEEEIQSICIFGYQCKVFREDEKAMYIDQGKHLIPWMGDPALMIDRYDGRGHISDLSPYDSENVDRHHMMMTDREKAIEKACDEERYLELNTDIMQQQTYEEEEMKRLYEAMGEGYSAVGFNYDQQGKPPQSPVPQQANTEEEEDEDEAYETIPALQVPKGVNLPPTIKMHAIIEKTAAFIAKQGQQMEIVIATKQSSNPQFRFLHYSHELNVYYKHIVRMIKKGKYTPPPQETYHKQQRRRKSSESHTDGLGGYLHPTLGGQEDHNTVPAAPMSSQKFLDSVTAKLPSGQIANTAYAKLLSNLKKHRPESPSPPVMVKPSEASTAIQRVEPTKNDEQVHFATKHKRKKTARPIDTEQMITVPGPDQPPPPGTVPPEPLPVPQASTAEDIDGIPVDTAEEHYYYSQQQDLVHHHNSSHSTSDLTSSDQHHLYGESHQVNASSYDYYNYGSHATNADIGNVDGTSLPSQYFQGYSGKDSASVHSGQRAIPGHIVVPSEQTRPIIDKMAEYVVRNGPEFEMMMKNKNDERFIFLNSWHEYNAYYEYKREQCRIAVQRQQEGTSARGRRKGRQARSDSDSDESSSGTSKGVKFSIKTKDTGDSAAGIALSTQPARRMLLGYDDSDDDDEDSCSSSSNKPQQQPVAAEVSNGTKKQPTELLRNKLAQAARDKMVAAKEEEKVKAERKKKAAMFAKLLKTDAPNSPGHLPISASAPSLLSMEAELPDEDSSRGRSPASHVIHGPSIPPTATSSQELTLHGPQLPPGGLPIPLPTSTTQSPAPPPPEEVHILSSSSESEQSRSRSRSPSVVITAETYVSKKRRSISHSRSRSRSRSPRDHRKNRRGLSSLSRDRESSRRYHRKSSRKSRNGSPAPAMYRSSSPNSRRSSRKRRRSKSPHKSHSSRSSRTSRKSRDRSEDRSKKSRKSRSHSKSSRPKSKRKRDKSKEKKKSKKLKKKPKMVPIPELSAAANKPKQTQHSSDLETEEGEIHDHSEADNTSGSTTPRPGTNSKAPSENILSKVRAMLKAQHDELFLSDND